MSSIKNVPSIESMERSLSQRLGRPVAIIPDLEKAKWGRFLTQPKHDDRSIPFGWSIVDDFINDEPIEPNLISAAVPDDPPAPLVDRPCFQTILQKIKKNVFVLVALYAAFSSIPSTPSISSPSPSISYPSYLPSISYPFPSISYPSPSISYPSPSISYPSSSTSYPFPSISYPSPSISYPSPSISYPSPSISSPSYFALPSAASASREIIDVQLCPTSTAIAIWVPSAGFVKVPFNEASCKSDNSNKALVLVMTAEESPLPEFLKVIQTFSVYKVLSDVCGKQVSLFAKLNPSSTALVPASFQKQSVAIGMVPPPLLDSSTELTDITTELNLRLPFRSIRLMWLWLGFLVFMLLPNENNQGFPRDRDHHGRSNCVYWQMLVLLFVTSTLFSEYFYGLLTSGILFPGFPAVALPLWSQSPVIVPVSSTAIIVWVPLASPNVSALNKVSSVVSVSPAGSFMWSNNLSVVSVSPAVTLVPSENSSVVSVSPNVALVWSENLLVVSVFRPTVQWIWLSKTLSPEVIALNQVVLWFEKNQASTVLVTASIPTQNVAIAIVPLLLNGSTDLAFIFTDLESFKSPLPLRSMWLWLIAGWYVVSMATSSGNSDNQGNNRDHYHHSQPKNWYRYMLAVMFIIILWFSSVFSPEWLVHDFDSLSVNLVWSKNSSVVSVSPSVTLMWSKNLSVVLVSSTVTLVPSENSSVVSVSPSVALVWSEKSSVVLLGVLVFRPNIVIISWVPTSNPCISALPKIMLPVAHQSSTAMVRWIPPPNLSPVVTSIENHIIAPMVIWCLQSEILSVSVKNILVFLGISSLGSRLLDLLDKHMDHDSMTTWSITILASESKVVRLKFLLLCFVAVLLCNVIALLVFILMYSSEPGQDHDHDQIDQHLEQEEVHDDFNILEDNNMEPIVEDNNNNNNIDPADEAPPAEHVMHEDFIIDEDNNEIELAEEAPPQERPRRKVVTRRRQPPRICDVRPKILASRKHLWRKCRDRVKDYGGEGGGSGKGGKGGGSGKGGKGGGSGKGGKGGGRGKGGKGGGSGKGGKGGKGMLAAAH